MLTDFSWEQSTGRRTVLHWMREAVSHVLIYSRREWAGLIALSGRWGDQNAPKTLRLRMPGLGERVRSGRSLHFNL